MTSFTRAVHAWIGLIFVLILASNLGAQARQPNVDLSMNNSDFRSPALCELSCYAATYSFSTVPYYSLDQPRNVTLVYNGDQANPRPFIYADVHGASSVAVTRYTMRATVNGNAVTFLNGETLLTFTGSQPSTPVRLGGQFDARTVATDIYPLVVTVEATYADAVIGETISSGHIMIVNEAGSQIANGWTVAGHQRLKQTVSPGYMITNGDASATRFSALGVVAADFTTLTYDGSNGTYTRPYPDGSRTTFNAAGEHTAFIAQNGHTISYRYHPDGRLKYIGDPFRAQPSGPLTSIGLAYDANGLDLIQEPSADGTQWAGRQTLFVVDSNRCLVSAEDPDRLMTTFTCDSNGRLETITDRKGGVSTLIYNTNSWKLSQVKFPTIPVDAGNGTTTNKNPLINYSPWQTKGVPTSPTSSASPWTAPVVSGVVGSVTDPAGRVTVLKANRFGQGIDITEPHGRRTIIASSFGILPRKIIRPNGAIDTLGYDSYGRVIRSHPAGEYLTTYAYTTGGLLSGIGGPGARAETRTYYGGTNHLAQVSLGGSPAQTLNYSYDPATQRVASMWDNSGHTTIYTYDSRFGNLRQLTSPGNRTTVKEFDARGRDSVITWPQTAPQTTLYDVLNRVTSASASGTTITLGYNQLYQTDLVDANGNHYHTDYNALGWPTSQCDALTLCHKTRYDASGLVTSTTNRRNQMVTFTRDAGGRLAAQTGSGVVTNNYGYSSDGRIMVAWNEIQRDSTFLDPGSQTLPATDSVVTWIDGKRFRVFNRRPRAIADTGLTTITSNTGVTFQSRRANYSPSGFLDSLMLDGTTISTFAPNSDGTGGTNTIAGGGTRTARATATHAPADVDFTNVNLRNAFRRNYHYSLGGKILQVMTGNVFAYGYDELGRLSNAAKWTDCYWSSWPGDTISGPLAGCNTPISSEDFSYDAMGNRTDNGGIPTTANRYAALKSTNYYYDADGNVVQKYNTNGLYNYQWFWNTRGQLDSTTKDSWHRTRFDYNALGKPVRIWDGDPNGQSLGRYLLWDGDALIAEFWPNGQRDVDYVYLPGTIDQPFASTHGATVPTTVRYQEVDVLGNVIGTHRNGFVDQSNTYDAWGVLTSTNADSHLQWKGLFWNGANTGLHYMRNRWYDPEGGRFVSEDPAGFIDGINLYTFAGNDPINGVDPFGLWCVKIPLPWFSVKIGDDCYGKHQPGPLPKPKRTAVPQCPPFEPGNLGQYAGEEAHEFYVGIFMSPSVTWYEKLGAGAGGYVSGLWTPETMERTIGYLLMGYGGRITGPGKQFPVNEMPRRVRPMRETFRWEYGHHNKGWHLDGTMTGKAPSIAGKGPKKSNVDVFACAR